MSKENKKEKFFCITNCLPVKSKAAKSKKNGSRQPFKNENDDPECTSVEDNCSVADRMNHTRQWLRNVNANTEYNPAGVVQDELRQQNAGENREERRHDSLNESTKKSKLNLTSSSNNTLKDAEENKAADESALTSVSRNHHRRTKVSRRRLTGLLDTDGTSMVGSCVSLATEIVSVNLNGSKSLGITIVGHFNSRQGDCGIFVGCVSKDGAAAETGRIEPGDLIMEVNDIDLDNLSNDTALNILRREISKRGVLKLVLAKYWDLDEQENDVVVTKYPDDMRSSAPTPREPGPLNLPLDDERAMRRRRFNDYGHFFDHHAHAVDYYARPSSVFMPHHMPFYPSLPPFLPRQMPQMPPAYVDLGYSEARRPPVPHLSPFRADLPSNIPFLGSEFVDWIRSNVPRMSAVNEARRFAQQLVSAGYVTGSSGVFHEGEWYVIRSNDPLPKPLPRFY